MANSETGVDVVQRWPTVKRVLKKKQESSTNSETGVERPINPPQKAVLYKEVEN